MLTGDENIVDINFTVFWVIKDAQSYLFNIRGPEATVKSAAESAMREVVGETPIAQALSEGRGKIETDTQAPAARYPRLLRRRDRGHPAAVAEGRSAGPGHRRVPRRAARAGRSRAAAQRGRILPQRHHPAGARRRGADQAGGRCLPPGDHRPRPGRRRPFPLGLQRLQGVAGRHGAAPLPRNDGRDPEEQQQGDHRQAGRRRDRRPAVPAAACARQHGTASGPPGGAAGSSSAPGQPPRAGRPPAPAVPPLRRQ